jgi:hypothetical protein
MLYIFSTIFLIISIFKAEFYVDKKKSVAVWEEKQLSERLEPITDLCHLSPYFINI